MLQLLNHKAMKYKVKKINEELNRYAVIDEAGNILAKRMTLKAANLAIHFIKSGKGVGI